MKTLNMNLAVTYYVYTIKKMQKEEYHIEVQITPLSLCVLLNLSQVANFRLLQTQRVCRQQFQI